jgi:uncharacterized repeat protein (TIGR01451 family)
LTECTAPAPIQLNAQNWRTGVAVAITAVDDYRIDGPQPCAIGGSVGSSDLLYQGAPLAPVTVTVQDDDVAGILFTAPNEQLSELTDTATFTVALSSEPVADVMVTLVSLDRSECTVPTTVTLTPALWQQGVPVMLSTVRDNTDDGAQACTISALANSSDNHYNNLLSDEFEFTVDDANMVLMEAVLEPSTTAAEIGDVITYTYRVTNTGDVTLTLQAVDAALGAVTFADHTLAPGATAVAFLLHTVQESDLPGPLTNSAMITGRSPAGQLLKATASATVTVAAHPQLEVNVVRLGPPIVVPGTIVTYQVTLVNVGHIPASVTSITSAPVRQPQAAALTANPCQAPLTIAAGATHQCVLLWTATADENDTVHYTVTVDAVGLRDFTATARGSDIVVVSSPTAAGPLRIYLPLVNR